MDRAITAAPATTSGATQETEPEVWAAINSAQGNPNLPTSFRADDRARSLGGTMLLLAAAVALGYGAACFFGSRG
jgi:hypothetical protein